MKKFYKAVLCCFFAGLVLMGIGTAIQLFELSTFTYVDNSNQQKDEMITESINIELPNNLAKIYRLGYSGDFDVVKDETLSGNNAVIDVTHLKNYNVTVTPNFIEDYYLYNSFTEKFSKYNVNTIVFGWGVENADKENDLDNFKKLLSDFKHRIINSDYNYDNYKEPEFTIRVSKEGYERFAKVPEGYDLYSYSAYMTITKEKEEEEKEKKKEILEQYGISAEEITDESEDDE